ncbi:MAG: hypothetical protein LIP03_07305 [Bacteroidales bacterium]|nr:hypothetical protein [Bacteroidales bacterium]
METNTTPSIRTSRYALNSRSMIAILIIVGVAAIVCVLTLVSSHSRRGHNNFPLTEYQLKALLGDGIEVHNFEFENGWKYTGELDNGVPCGEGIAVTDTGDRFVGTWVDGQLPEGKLYAISDGNELLYEGSFNEYLQPEGFGRLTYERGKNAGDVYIGNFSAGKRNGIGKLTHANGAISFGIWVDGVLNQPDNHNFAVEDKTYGIDVSKFNDGIDWDNLALYADPEGDVYHRKPKTTDYLQPVSFVYAKASEGATMQDPLYAEHIAEATAHYLPHGSYHFMCFSTSTAKEQAENFLQSSFYCKDDELPPMIDLESDQAKIVGKAKVQEMVKEWIAIVQKATGKKPIIYTNDSFVRKYLDMDQFSDYIIWLASYGDAQIKKEPKSHPWDIWQFTHKGVSPGVDEIDINVFNGSIADFYDRFGIA